jgi:hypothetical protein
MKRTLVIAAALLATLLSGCDMLGIDSPEKIAAAKDADGRAVGAACRQAGRAIEDCYTLNKKAEKASVFAGWRDMNDYMRENKIPEVVPQLSPPGAAVKLAQAATEAKPAEKADAEEAPASRPAAKGKKADKADKSEKAPKDSKEAKAATESSDAGS